jgi:hypothetical protein
MIGEKPDEGDESLSSSSKWQDFHQIEKFFFYDMLKLYGSPLIYSLLNYVQA